MSVVVKGMRMPYGCANCDFVGSPIYDSKGRASYSCNVPVENIRGKDVTDHVIAMYEGARMSFPKWCPLVDLGKHGDLIDRDELRAKFPEPIDIIDPQQALIHITGVWAEIDCADVVIEAEDG